MNRQVVLRAALIALGTVIALAVLEVGIRVSFFLGQPLSVTAKRFPPALAEDCGPKETWAKTGHLIFPSENPDLVYELKPNIDTCYFGARVFTNDQGLRADRHYAIPKPPNTYRILLLGDSQTFGQGVEFEDTYGQVLERQLNQASNGPKVEVINGGVDGYNTAQEAAFLVHRGLEFKPDCVMILFIGNDLQYPNFVAGKDDHLATDRLFLLSGVLGDRSARIPERYQMQVGREGYERALRLIAEVCEEQGITVINCFSPGDRGSVLEDPAAWMEIDAMQRRLGIRLVPFELPWGPEYWVSDDNRHLNAQGTKLLASRVLQELEKQNLIYPEIRQQRSE